MLIWLLNQLRETSALHGADAALAKITLRTALAAVCSFLLAVLLGPWLIAWLRARFREPIVSPSARIEQLHGHKQWTPTMGGLFIVAGIFGATLLAGDVTSPYVLASLVLLLGYGALGVHDDLAKLATGRGLPARTKLLGQVAVATAVAALVYSVNRQLDGGLATCVPLAGTRWQLGVWFIPLATVVIVGSSNAVNLTDGLDGLAAGCLVFAVAATGIGVYAAGHAQLAAYLNIIAIPGSGELAIVAGAMIGGVLGFLWFNCHPAQVFMGDTGSLPLGGLLGLLAIVARQEFLLVITAGVFVAEAASVLLQVGWYKLFRRRVFRCAPLHHHFQFAGWSENKIVVRFWIASALCAVLGLAGLKGNSDTQPKDSEPQTAARATLSP